MGHAEANKGRTRKKMFGMHNFALDAVDIHVCVYITEIIHTHTAYKGDADKL